MQKSSLDLGIGTASGTILLSSMLELLLHEILKALTANGDMRRHTAVQGKDHIALGTPPTQQTPCAVEHSICQHSCSQGLHKLQQEKAVGKDLVGCHDVV